MFVYERKIMAVVEKTVLVNHSAEKMYHLVDQVENYPQFLPWCGGSELHGRTPAQTEATIHIDYHSIKQSFTTRNENKPYEEIQIQLVKGPFKQLHGSWRFVSLRQNACKIIFNLHYEFSSKILEKILGPVFNHIANTFVDAFIHRAEALYGDDEL